MFWISTKNPEKCNRMGYVMLQPGKIWLPFDSGNRRRSWHSEGSKASIISANAWACLFWCALKIRQIYMTECPEYLDKENRWLWLLSVYTNSGLALSIFLLSQKFLSIVPSSVPVSLGIRFSACSIYDSTNSVIQWHLWYKTQYVPLWKIWKLGRLHPSYHSIDS